MLMIDSKRTRWLKPPKSWRDSAFLIIILSLPSLLVCLSVCLPSFLSFSPRNIILRTSLWYFFVKGLPTFTMAAADVRDMLDLPAEGQPRPHKKQKVVEKEKRPGW